MAKLRANNISISLDGYAAGPDQGPDQPLGVGGMRLHEWAFELAAFRTTHGMEGGIVNESTPVIDRATGILYLVARTKENGSYMQRLHALLHLPGMPAHGPRLPGSEGTTAKLLSARREEPRMTIIARIDDARGCFTRRCIGRSIDGWSRRRHDRRL